VNATAVGLVVAMAVALGLMLWGGRHHDGARGYSLVWLGLALAVVTFWCGLLLGVFALAEGLHT
jgi:ABC-type polysaccharide/polyol phosphate export permease